MKKFDLEVGGPCTTTQPEPMNGVVVGDGGGEAVIENHLYRLPNHTHKDSTTVVATPFRNQDHSLPGRLLREDSVSERRLYQLHHQFPLLLFPFCPFLSPFIRPSLFWCFRSQSRRCLTRTKEGPTNLCLHSLRTAHSTSYSEGTESSTWDSITDVGMFSPGGGVPRVRTPCPMP